MKNTEKTKTSQDTFFKDVLKDIKNSGKTREWEKRKAQSEAIALAFSQTKGLERVAERMGVCGLLLEFHACNNENHGKILTNANFCKIRSCIMCQSRRSQVVQAQVLDMITWHLEMYPTDVPLLLTLTVPNVPGDELSKLLDRMAKGFERLMKIKKVKVAVRSWFKSLETTHNTDRKDYHPHFHTLIMVPQEYFYKKYGMYITHKEWLDLWKQSMRDARITQVDIRTIDPKDKESLASAVAEVAKYATKPLSYVSENEKGEWEADSEVAETLHYALKGRRLVGFGGYFKQARKERMVVDIEKADLVFTDSSTEEEIGEDGVVNEEGNSKSSEKICRCRVCNEIMHKEAYRWDPKRKNYFRVYPEEEERERRRQWEAYCRGPT